MQWRGARAGCGAAGDEEDGTETETAYWSGLDAEMEALGSPVNTGHQQWQGCVQVAVVVGGNQGSHV
jgi:hypothetical protein